MKPMRIAVALIVTLVVLTGAGALEEKHPNGRVKLKYAVDAEGRKTGPYLEYHENGKLKIKANCKAGDWEGPYTSFYPTGKAYITAVYKSGKLNGPYSERNELGLNRLTATYRDGRLDGLLKLYDNGQVCCIHECKNGEPALPRTLAETRATLAAIEAVPNKNADLLAFERQSALRRLMAYRFLVGVPYANLELDDDMNKCCQAGARLCEKIGRLDHTPKNPGWPEDEYQLGYKGTSQSNLHQGAGTLAKSVDGYMDDSDPSNVDRVGHRRWCLNPALQKTGFGKSGDFFSMYSFDKSQKEMPDYDFISYPASGFMPIQYFGPNHAWNVSLNPKKYKEPTSKVTVAILSQPDAVPKGKIPPKLENVALNHKKIHVGGIGVPYCIIFRPERYLLADGKRYWVEIGGLEKTDGTPATLRFLVFFVNLL